MGEQPVQLDALVLQQDIHSQTKHAKDCHELGPHEVRQCDGGVRGAEEQGATGLQPNDGFTREEVVGHQSATIGRAFQGFGVGEVVEGWSRQFTTRGLEEFCEDTDPLVPFGSTIVGMNHGDRKPIRGRHHVKFRVNPFQVVFEDDHRKD